MRDLTELKLITRDEYETRKAELTEQLAKAAPAAIEALRQQMSDLEERWAADLATAKRVMGVIEEFEAGQAKVDKMIGEVSVLLDARKEALAAIEAAGESLVDAVQAYSARTHDLSLKLAEYHEDARGKFPEALEAISQALAQSAAAMVLRGLQARLVAVVGALGSSSGDPDPIRFETGVRNRVRELIQLFGS